MAARLSGSALGGTLLLAACLLAGCVATGGLFQDGPPPVEPWQMPEGAYPSQRLYRVKYRGPEGEAGFKLTLYLEAEAKYRMLAADLGRKLWSLYVDASPREESGGAAGEAVWLDYRRKEYCRVGAAGALRFVPLADLPLVSLPRLLLGLMPADPAASLNRAETRVSFLDSRGYRWDGVLSGQQLEWWSLLEAGETIAWWRREDGGGVFSDSRGQQEVRWREVVSEPLESPLAAPEIPARFGEGACGGTSR